ncbi:MFS transporter [Streptomyces sp. NPDC059534]|uniref:MFS transporter n=1 Tax=Streptomyces sp. NPDC059534 TaxID=3346859 RepID=UPI00368E826A
MTALSAPARTAAPRSGARTGLLLAALAAPAAMGVSGPSLALPEAARELAVSPASAAWLMTAFGLGMAAGTPLLSATAGRRHGPAGVIRAAAVLVVLGALLVLLAPGLPLSVAGRALEAAGAAGLNVAAFQLAGRDSTGRTPGLVAIGSAAGGTVGLFAGAAVAGALGWRAALILPLLSLLALLPALRLAEEGQGASVVRGEGDGHSRPQPHLPSPSTSQPRTPSPTQSRPQSLSQTQSPTPGRAQSPSPGPSPSAGAGPSAKNDRRRSRPLPLPLDILGNRRFRAAAGLMLAVATVNFALMYAAPRRVAALTGWGSVETGAAASLAALAGALLSWLLIRSALVLGARRVRVLLALGSAGALVLALTAPWPVAVLVGSGTSALVTAGGQGLLTGAATGSLPTARHGLAISLFNLAFLTGVAAGPALAALAAPTT